MANKLSRWEPFQDMVTLREAMGRLFEESIVRPFEDSGLAATGGELAVDIYEKDDDLIVKASVPGISAEELDITVTGDVLSIKGETKAEEEVNDQNYHRREFRYGSFCRSVRLPVEVDSGKAEAVFKDGILTLTFPKPEEKKPKAIKIKTKK